MPGSPQPGYREAGAEEIGQAAGSELGWPGGQFATAAFSQALKREHQELRKASDQHCACFFRKRPVLYFQVIRARSRFGAWVCAGFPIGACKVADWR